MPPFFPPAAAFCAVWYFVSFGLFIPSLLDSLLFLFRCYKSGQCKCYKPEARGLLGPPADPFASHSISFCCLRPGNKWVEISRGFLTGYAKDMSSEGEGSGSTVSRLGTRPGSFCPILSVCVHGGFLPGPGAGLLEVG